MTVSTETGRVEYTGNGTTTEFAVPFEFQDDTDIDVYVSGTLKTLTTHYTVDGGDGSTGSVTFVTAPAAATDVVIVDHPPITQATDYTENDDFPAESHERALDKLTRLVRRMDTRIDRTIHLADSEAGVDSTELPPPDALKLIGWDADGTGLANYSADSISADVTVIDWVSDTYDGDGSTVNFTLSRDPGVAANCDVSVAGITQRPGTDYTVSGTTLTFTTAPPIGTDNICARYGSSLGAYTASAENVAYLPAGTGAVETDVRTKLRETISVMDFGATGAGTPSNDAAAIQAAIDAASAAGGGSVFFPPGVYYTGTTTIALKNKVVLVGPLGTKNGNDALALTEAPATIHYVGSGAAVTCGDGVTGVSGAGIIGLQLYGAATGVNGLSMQGGAGSACVGNVFRDMLIASFTTTGVDIIDSVFVTDFDRVAVRSCTSGFYLREECNDTTLLNCEANNNTGSGYLIGDGAGTSQNSIRLIACRAEGNTQYGIKLNAPSSAVAITDVYLESNGYGGINTDSAGTTLTLSVRGGSIHVNSASYDAIGIGAGCFFLIEGIQFLGSNRYDINLSNAAHNYYGRIGVCRHGATNASGRINNGGASASMVEIVDTYAGTHNFQGGIQAGNVNVAATSVLDWYLEGTFTPVVAGSSTAGSHTYSVQTGYYTRIGNRVLYNLDVAISSKDAAMAGNVRITGLPYTSSASTTSGSACAVGLFDLVNLSAGYSQLTPMIQPSAAYILVRESGDNNSAAIVDAAAISTNTRFTVSGHYMV